MIYAQYILDVWRVIVIAMEDDGSDTAGTCERG